MDRLIYFDNAATTPVSKPVLDAMMPYFSEYYGNPSSIYDFGSIAHTAIEKARAQTAAAIGAAPNEIFFTSCGSESDNWAIKGVARKLCAKGKNQIITSIFEHHAILHSVEHLRKEGFEIVLLPVNADGYISAADVENAICERTALVSIMYANNEIGTIQPIEEIGAICKKHGVLFHTDAVQAVGNLPIDVKRSHLDLLSLSGHKLNAPKGVGALYIRKGIMLDTLIDGGAQERMRRAGTENVASIVGLGAAIEIAVSHIDEKAVYLRSLRDRYLKTALSIPHSRLNGGLNPRLPGNANVSFEGIEGESILLKLNLAGVCASSGSACASSSLDPSHVLLSIGLPHEIAHGSIRTTFGTQNTMEEVEYLCDILPEIIKELRAMSPVWERILQRERDSEGAHSDVQ